MSGSPEAKAALPSQIGGRLAVRGRLLGNAGAEYAKERRSDRGGRSGPRTEASGERTERMPADATQQNTHGLTDYSATLGAPPEGKITRRHPISRWIKSPLLYQLSYRVDVRQVWKIPRIRGKVDLATGRMKTGPGPQH